MGETKRRKKQYSVSRLDLFDRCPAAYKTVHLDGIPRGESEPLMIGREVHELIEAYLNHLSFKGLTTDWEWAEKVTMDYSHPEVLDIWNKFYGSFLLPQADKGYIEAGLAFNRKWKPTSWGRGFFRMVLDWHFRQGDMAVIYDWKTNRVLPKTVEKDLQLLTYGWGVLQTHYPDASEVLLRLHFLRYGKEVEVILAPKELRQVPEMLMDKISQIEGEKHFDPKPGSFCAWCGVNAYCPAVAKAVVPTEIVAPASIVEAEKAASILLTLQSMEKQLANLLKQWVKEHGPVRVGDVEFGAKYNTVYELDPQSVVEALLSQGLEKESVWPLLSLTKTSLEKGLKRLRRQDLLATILAPASSKLRETIDFHKVP